MARIRKGKMYFPSLITVIAVSVSCTKFKTQPDSLDIGPDYTANSISVRVAGVLEKKPHDKNAMIRILSLLL